MGSINKPAQKVETLIIGGVPYHVIHKETNQDSNHPIYETIDDPAIVNQTVNVHNVKNSVHNRDHNSAQNIYDERMYAELENLYQDESVSF